MRRQPQKKRQPDAPSTQAQSSQRAQQDILNIQAAESNRQAMERKEQQEPESKGGFDLGNFLTLGGTSIGVPGFESTQTNLHDYAEKQADRGATEKRYEGFGNLLSRNIRRVAGEEEGDDPNPLWGHTPYIDAMADREIADGEPGFWTNYSGFNNLVQKIIGAIYGVGGV